MLLKPSLEGEATGNTERELEYVFYGRIGNMAALEQAASKEVQDQWSIHGVDGQIRVRATDGTKFEMAIKTWQKGVTSYGTCIQSLLIVLACICFDILLQNEII